MICTYSLSVRRPQINLGADSTAIDEVVLPSTTTSRHTRFSESFLFLLLPDAETVSDVAWTALAWHKGVLEHHPGMLKNYLCSNVCNGSPFYSTTCTKECTLARYLGGRGRQCHENLSNRLLSGSASTVLQQQSS